MITHGLRSTYTHGCHCTDCATANRIYQTNRSRRGQVPPGGSHGYSGYINFGCRCPVCTEAHDAQLASWIANQQEGPK